MPRLLTYVHVHALILILAFCMHMAQIDFPFQGLYQDSKLGLNQVRKGLSKTQAL